MENRNFKKALPYLATAVICGVVLISAGSVFGNNPNVNPPGLGVNPTFTGMTVDGDVQVNGAIDATTLTVQGDIVTGGIESPNPGSFVIQDALLVAGNLFIDGFLKSDLGALILQDNVQIKADIDANPPTSAATLKIGPTDAMWLGLDKNELMSIGGPLSINRDSDTDVEIGHDAHLSDLLVHGNITTSVGKIGKFYRYRSPGLNINAQTWLGAYTSACPSGQTISCSVVPASNNVAWLANYLALGVSPTVDANGINGCQAKVYNSNAANTLQLHVWNVCFDPTGTALPGTYSMLGAGSLTP